MSSTTYNGDWSAFVEEMRQLIGESKWSAVLWRIGDDYNVMHRLAGALNLTQEQVDLMTESCDALAAKRQVQGDFYESVGLPRPQHLITKDAFGRTPEEAESDKEYEARAFPPGGKINHKAFCELMDRRNMRHGGKKMGWLGRRPKVTTAITFGIPFLVLCWFAYYGWFSLSDGAILWIVKLAVTGFVGFVGAIAVFVIHTFLRDGLDWNI